MSDAPASRQANASAAISAAVLGTCGLASLDVPPLMAASMMTGSSIARPYGRSVRASRESLQAAGLRLPLRGDLRRVPVDLRLRAARRPAPEERAGGVVA